MRLKYIFSISIVAIVCTAAYVFLYLNTNSTDPLDKQAVKHDEKVGFQGGGGHPDIDEFSNVKANKNQANKIVESKVSSVESSILDLESLDEIVVNNGGGLLLNSEAVEVMTREQLSSYFLELSNTMIEPKTVEILDALTLGLEEYAEQSNILLTHNVECSDILCGFIFETNDYQSAQIALDDITRTESFKARTRGGTLRIIEEQGIYYGVVVAVITESSISIH